MRALVLTASILSTGSLMCGSAWASSITEITPSGRVHSIIEKTCAACDQANLKRPRPAVEGPGIYHVPSLGADIQTTEIRAINGEEKIVRTEAWLGGSPVTFISKLPAGMSPQQKAEATLPVINGPANTVKAIAAAAPDGIDNSATTAAVGAQSFDDFSLRLK